VRTCYVVMVTPAQENAGSYEVSCEIAGIPDDISFMSWYECEDFDQASGYFDEIVRLLGPVVREDAEWLDDFNRCLSVGYPAKVTLYKFSAKRKDMYKMANTVIMVGGGIAK